jgi:hypothetical protein
VYKRDEVKAGRREGRREFLYKQLWGSGDECFNRRKKETMKESLKVGEDMRPKAGFENPFI